MSGISKRVSGSWVNGDYGIMKTATDTITTLPAVLYPNDTTATVGLKGNTVQSGTPTPDNPIMPEGTGDKTGNLINVYANDTSNGYVNNAMLLSSGNVYAPSYSFVSEYQPINEGVTYTLDTGGRSGDAQSICFYTSNKQFISGVAFASRTIITFTTPQGARYFRCTVMRIQTDTESYKRTMLNLGSTAKPFEPYGYKIPISSAGQTTPVYLGEIETTRKIEKLVLDGNESWVYHQYLNYNTVDTPLPYAGKESSAVSAYAMCSHYQARYGNADGICRIIGEQLRFYDDIRAADVATWKAYLAQQYAAGTPVCVWYVLATEETGIVNEPLMRIGNYADTVSGITIPVTAGGDTISVDTTVQPSEVTATYKGWHPAVVHERNNGAWTE